MTQDEYHADMSHEDDSAALAYLAEERQERSVAVIYDCVMRGLSEADARHLCWECNVRWEDVCNWTQPVLRRMSDDPTVDMFAPF